MPRYDGNFGPSSRPLIGHIILMGLLVDPSPAYVGFTDSVLHFIYIPQVLLYMYSAISVGRFQVLIKYYERDRDFTFDAHVYEYY